MSVRTTPRAEQTSAGRDQVGRLFRGLAAGGVLISATVHFLLWAQGISGLETIGPLFLLNAIGGGVIGLVVYVWRHWLPMLAAAGFGALTLGAYIMATTVGLFGYRDVASGVPAQVSAVAEIVAIVGGLVGIAVEGVRRSNRSL